MLQFIYKYVSPKQDEAFMLEINRLLNSLCDCLVDIFNRCAKSHYKKFKPGLPNTANVTRAKIHKIANMIYETCAFLHESVDNYKMSKEFEKYVLETMEMSRTFLSLVLAQTSPRLTILNKW